MGTFNLYQPHESFSLGGVHGPPLYRRVRLARSEPELGFLRQFLSLGPEADDDSTVICPE